MIYLPDTNACIRCSGRNRPQLIFRWRSTKAADITLCSIVVYELSSATVQSAVARVIGEGQAAVRPFRSSSGRPSSRGTAFAPAAFVGVTLVLLAAALVACLVPATRAASVDPMVALRQD